MGGEKEKVEQPRAPSVAETSQQALQAQVSGLPQILGAQREFGPQFAEATRGEQEILSPELAGARRTLTRFFDEPEGLNPQEIRQLQQDVRGAQSARGFALESGVGAQEEFSKLTDLRQRLKERRLNIALQTAGRVPQTSRLVQNVTPGQAFGLTSNVFGTQTQAAGAAAGRNIKRQGQTFGLIGDIIGAGATLGGAALQR